MGKNLAVQGCTLQIQGGTGPAPKITNQPSSSIKVGGKGVFFGQIAFTLSGVKAGDIVTPTGSWPGTINGTGANVLENGQKAVLEGDVSATVTVRGTKPGPNGTQLPAQGNVTVKVSAAGQTDVIAL